MKVGSLIKSVSNFFNPTFLRDRSKIKQEQKKKEHTKAEIKRGSSGKGGSSKIEKVAIDNCNRGFSFSSKIRRMKKRARKVSRRSRRINAIKRQHKRAA